MYDDIVICEILHEDFDEEEGCNPHQIIVGNSSTERYTCYNVIQGGR